MALTHKPSSRTDPLVATLYALLASTLVALALTERFRELPAAVVACVAAWVIARLDQRTRGGS